MIKFTEGLGTRGHVWLIYGEKAAAEQNGGLKDEERGGRAKRRLERRRDERGLSDERTRERNGQTTVVHLTQSD
jgi:hypothetical protein